MFWSLIESLGIFNPTARVAAKRYRQLIKRNLLTIGFINELAKFL